MQYADILNGFARARLQLTLGGTATASASYGSMRLIKTTSEDGRRPPRAEPVDVLRETSRTFYFSIVNLPPGIREAVMSAYLSLRALDEIEDHPRLDRLRKIKLLLDISSNCEEFGDRGPGGLASALEADQDDLPEVTNRLGEWFALAPKTIARSIWDASAVMARRMAFWAGNAWQIRTEADLDGYTFSVAGAVGLLLSDLWFWHDGTTSNRGHAVGFGRGLQAVNILRNRVEDLARGVDFFPEGWAEEDLRLYAERNLSLADAYVETLAHGTAREFCRLPLALAHATLDALARGEPKLSRSAVLEIVGRVEATQLTLQGTPSHIFDRENQH
jgi:farnesyl-diphosphate farnesyltransferase